MDWVTCSHYFYLAHVLGHKVFDSSVYTHWGHLIHRLLQDTLTGGDKVQNSIKLINTWQRFCRLYKLDKECYWAVPGALAIATCTKRFEEEFGKFEVLKTEERLALPIEGYPQIFKGFIDLAVLRTSDGKIIIADIKSCSTSYMFNKYRDKYKDYQLTLYKHFYCQKYNIDPKEVETYFITVDRSRKSKKPLGFTRVTSGPKKVKNALELIYGALDATDRGTFIKNRGNCFKWGEDKPCEFYNTPLCTR